MTRNARKTLWLPLALAGVLCTGTASAQMMPMFDGTFQLRTSAIGLIFDAESDNLDLDIKDTANLAIDGTYFLTHNLAVNVLATFINSEVETGNASLGSVDLLPPIFTVQWHFTPDQPISPYLGVGFNYNVFVNESGSLTGGTAVGPGLTTGPGLNVDVDNTFGIVGEGGVDVALTSNVYANLNFKFLTFEADVDVDGQKADELDVDAFIVGAGIGYRF